MSRRPEQRSPVAEATGAAPPAFVGRRPVSGVAAAALITLFVAWATWANRTPDGRLPVRWTVLLLALFVGTAAAWWWARRPRVVVGALGVWLAPTLDSPPEVYLWRDVDAVVHGRAPTNKTRSWFLGVRLLEPPVAGVTADVQVALDGTDSLDALVPGVGRYVADLVRDGRRLRLRTVREAPSGAGADSNKQSPLSHPASPSRSRSGPPPASVTPWAAASGRSCAAAGEPRTSDQPTSSNAASELRVEPSPVAVMVNVAGAKAP